MTCVRLGDAYTMTTQHSLIVVRKAYSSLIWNGSKGAVDLNENPQTFVLPMSRSSTKLCESFCLHRWWYGCTIYLYSRIWFMWLQVFDIIRSSIILGYKQQSNLISNV